MHEKQQVDVNSVIFLQVHRYYKLYYVITWISNKNHVLTKPIFILLWKLHFHYDINTAKSYVYSN